MAAVSARPTADHERIDRVDQLPDAETASQTSTVETAASSQMTTKDSSQSSVAHDESEQRTAMDLDAPARVNGVASDAPRVPRLQTNVAGFAPVNGMNGMGNGMSDPRYENGVNGMEDVQRGDGTSPTEVTQRAGGDLSLAGDMKQGQKRTASGHVKTPTSTTTLSPNGVPAAGTFPSNGEHRSSHKRTTSTNTQVNELSAQLRARLSYAMLKVQNGWESRTIDEIEAMASQHGSPMSLTSPWRQTAAGPRLQASAATTHASQVLNGSLKTDQPPTSAAHLPHSAFAIPSSSAPSLAPPVDFGTASNPRRTTLSGRVPPHLDGTNVSNLSASSMSSAASAHSGPLIPATPPLHDTPNTILQTPSQRATASERDAIETLLFMSSPGNSQTFRNGGSSIRPLSQTLHQSPPRAAPGASPQRMRPPSAKQVSFLPHANVAALAMHAVDNVPLSPRKRGLLDGANLETEAGIDRVLDQMPVDGDAESSSDESLGSVAPCSERAEHQVIVQ